MDSEENLGERSKCRKMDRDINNLCMRFCPEGVSYIPLGEATEMQRGTSITKKNIIEGTVPVIAGGQKPAYYCDKANRDADIITVAGSGAYAGYVSYWDCPVFVSDAFSVKAKEGSSTKYIYYAMQNLQSEIYATKKGGGVPHVHISSIEKMRIPLPPLPIQQEIVRILDTFTNLTAELTAELTARRKQYEYYRDELLTFGEDVSRVQLGLVCDFKYGKGNNIPNETGEYPVYGCNGIVSTTNTFNSEDAPIIGHIGSAGVVNWGKGKHFVTYNGTICRVKADKIRSRYAYYVLNSLHLERFVKGSQPFLSYGDFSKVLIPLPPIERQDEIVRILDQFDYFCNDLTSGIPAEISARQKQYEYYRNQLLTFNQIGG